MASTLMETDADSNARSFLVWDPLIRLIHWALALLILVNGIMTDEEGKLHELLGYAALALIGVRFLWGVIGPEPARFSAFPPSPAAALRHLRALMARDKTVHLSHNPLGALMAYNIWASVGIICVTGIMMGSIRFFGAEWVEEAHEIAFNWLFISVALHVAGVAFETWRSGVPLLWAMINGRKRVPGGRPVE